MIPTLVTQKTACIKIIFLKPFTPSALLGAIFLCCV